MYILRSVNQIERKFWPNLLFRNDTYYLQFAHSEMLA